MKCISNKGNHIGKEDLELLLGLHAELDRILDEGAAGGSELNETLKVALSRFIEIIHAYEAEKRISRTNAIYIAYLDYFNELSIISCSNEVRIIEPEEFFEKINGSGVIRNNTNKIESLEPVFSDNIVVRKLEVFNEFLGFVVLLGRNFIDFHRCFADLMASKIDTDIFQSNRYNFEKLKNDGVSEIEKILNSRLFLTVKYQRVVELIVDSIGCYSGYLVLPREGDMTVAVHYLTQIEQSPLDDQTVKNLARRTILEASDENNIIKHESSDVKSGELVGITLKTEQGSFEGVLILHHKCFKKAHTDIAGTYSQYIDSTLHMSRIYASVFEDFLKAVGMIIDRFDNGKNGHSHRVAVYAAALGNALNLSNIEMSKLRIASALHDINKLEHKIADKNNSGSMLAGNILSGLFPLEFEDTHYFNAGSQICPGEVGADKMPVISKIIAAADMFDSLTSDMPYHKGLSREKAIEVMIREAKAGNIPQELVSLFAGDKVWSMIKTDFQEIKIDSAVSWYKKDMVADIEPLIKELEVARSSLDDINRQRKKFDRGEEIDLMALEDSFLAPSDKDKLIQREVQKNLKAYRQLLDEMEAKYRARMNKLTANRDIETRFKEKFWDPQIIQDIFYALLRLNCNGFDMLEPRDDIAKNIPENSGKEKLSLIDAVEILLEESKKLKGFNDKYTAPLLKVQEIIEAVS